jgi:uncharacterized membrane protein YciS (DUF1049 family)
MDLFATGLFCTALICGSLYAVSSAIDRLTDYLRERDEERQ